MTMRQIFDWLAATPRKQYTLGEAVMGKEDWTTVPLSRGGRLLERAITFSGFVLAGMALFTGAPVLGLTAFTLLESGKMGGVITALAMDIGISEVEDKLEERAEKARIAEIGKTFDAIERQGGIKKIMERIQKQNKPESTPPRP